MRAALPGRHPHEDKAPVTDRVVFGVTAVLTLGFVIWGVTATSTLERVSDTLLSGLMHNGGWAFVLVASGFGFEFRIGPAQDEAPGGKKDDRDRKAPGTPPPPPPPPPAS